MKAGKLWFLIKCVCVPAGSSFQGIKVKHSCFISPPSPLPLLPLSPHPPLSPIPHSTRTGQREIQVTPLPHPLGMPFLFANLQQKLLCISLGGYFSWMPDFKCQAWKNSKTTDLGRVTTLNVIHLVGACSKDERKRWHRYEPDAYSNTKFCTWCIWTRTFIKVHDLKLICNLHKLICIKKYICYLYWKGFCY